LYFVTEHEIILIYSKSDDYEWLDEIVPTDEAKYNKNDENGKFTAVKLAKWGSGARREDRPKMYFPIKDPDGKNAYPKAPDGSEGRWRVGKARMELLVEKELIHWEKKNGDWIPYEKFHYEKGAVTRVKERSILFDIATTGDASNVLTCVFR